ncbi:MAG: hypothetical protein KGD63_11455 [Candidatus Lokiarchaeota archaeon]|nr:hypothetical protein [Candidatus Lokiarchaeota archaeon]
MVVKSNLNKNKYQLTYIIENIVVKSSIEMNLDLDLVSRSIEGSDYNSKRLPGLFLRFKNPKGVVIVFNNGKIIITGLLKFYHILLILKKFISLLSKIINFNPNLDINSLKTKIVNIVVTANYYRQINLDLATLLLNNVIYEPEIFPGLINKVYKPFLSVYLIFSTGKVILTGINKKELIETSLLKLGKIFKEKKLFLIN